MTVRTRAQLKGDADTHIPDNAGWLVSPEDVRERMKDIADSTLLPEDLTNASAKTTPVGADALPILDSKDSSKLKRLTWANLKAAIWSALGALINGGTGKTTPVDADAFALSDSEDSNKTKKLTWANLLAKAFGTANITITGGARITVLDLGSKSSGTVTPDPGGRPHQKYTNTGAHTLAPGSNYGDYYLDILNGSGAGAITTTGWTKVSGDSFTTTNGHKFRCGCSVTADGSTLVVLALQ